MRDEIDARFWADHGASFSEALDRLFKNVGIALKRLHEMQFSAPWRERGVHGPGQA